MCRPQVDGRDIKGTERGKKLRTSSLADARWCWEVRRDGAEGPLLTRVPPPSPPSSADGELQLPRPSLCILLYWTALRCISRVLVVVSTVHCTVHTYVYSHSGMALQYASRLCSFAIAIKTACCCTAQRPLDGMMILHLFMRHMNELRTEHTLT